MKEPAPQDYRVIHNRRVLFRGGFDPRIRNDTPWETAPIGSKLEQAAPETKKKWRVLEYKKG